jgi:hypothetical protein
MIKDRGGIHVTSTGDASWAGLGWCSGENNVYLSISLSVSLYHPSRFLDLSLIISFTFLRTILEWWMGGSSRTGERSGDDDENTGNPRKYASLQAGLSDGAVQGSSLSRDFYFEISVPCRLLDGLFSVSYAYVTYHTIYT